MLLRALLPAGWMPAVPGVAHAVITICTMDGPVRMALPDAPKPARDQHSHDRATVPCAFAAAAPFAPVSQAPALTAPPAFAQSVSNPVADSLRLHWRETAHAPRAPPRLA